jgi:hypothetical protein
MATASTQPGRFEPTPALYALVSVAVAAVTFASDESVVTALAGPVVLGVALALFESRRRIGHTLGGIRSWALDPFVPLGVGTVLAVLHAIAAQRYVGDDLPLADGLLLLSALFLAQGFIGLLSERMRAHALELAREAVFISAIAAVAVWLAWMEATWLEGDIPTRHAVVALAAAAAASSSLILAGRLASALGPPGRWFVAAPAALLLAGLEPVINGIAGNETSGTFGSAMSLAAAVLVAAGVAHRGLVGLRTTVGVSPSRVGVVRFVVVLAGVLLVPAVTIGRLLAEVEVSVPSLAASTTVLSVAAVAYLAGLARDWAQLERRALHDELTGLPNRRHFTERLAIAVADAAGGGECPTVMFCDLDRFKVVNDNLGHATGNQLLAIVADRLLEVLEVYSIGVMF